MRSFLPLNGDGFVLRDFTRDDAASLASIEFDPAVKQFLALPEKPLEEWVATFDPATYGGYAIEVGGDLAGRASLLRYQSGRKGYAEIAVVISRQFWGTGLGRRAASALLQIAFEHINAKGVVGVVHPAHIASIALLRALGFRKRGTVVTPSKPWQHGHLIYRLARRGA